MTIYIAPDITPVARRPVYRRIDPANPGRKATITLEEVRSGNCREPDPAIYRQCDYDFCWHLKDGV